MKFGLFGGAQANSGDPDAVPGQGFKDFIEFNVEAEALGYVSTFQVEHHFTGWNQVSATLNLLTWVAARTKTLRVGTAVMVLPWHNPVLLAEQAATLDLLSEGRLDLGVGRGYRFSEFRGFRISMDEADARFDETFDCLIKAWTAAGRFSHYGRFWQFDDIVVEPPTAQKPHPPRPAARPPSGGLRSADAISCSTSLRHFMSLANVSRCSGRRSRRAAGAMTRCRSPSPAMYTSPRIERTRWQRWNAMPNIGSVRSRYPRFPASKVGHTCWATTTPRSEATRFLSWAIRMRSARN